jgi:hypothetical protein
MTEEQKQTRMQKRQQQKVEPVPTADDLEEPIVRVSFGSWIMRILIVVILIVVAAVAGAMIGYSGIGSGNPLQVLNPSTWTHIFDIMNGKTE